MMEDHLIYKERRLVQRILTNPHANLVLFLLKMERSQKKKKPLKDKAILEQKSPQTLSAVLCNKSDSVMQGGGRVKK